MKTPTVFLNKKAAQEIKAPSYRAGERLGLKQTSRRGREVLDGKEAAKTLLGLGIIDQAFIDRNGLR